MDQNQPRRYDMRTKVFSNGVVNQGGYKIRPLGEIDKSLAEEIGQRATDRLVIVDHNKGEVFTNLRFVKGLSPKDAPIWRVEDKMPIRVHVIYPNEE